MAAAQRTLEVTLISAKDLKDVGFLTRMDVYAVASVDSFHGRGVIQQPQRTAADRKGGRNPSWDAVLRFTVPSSPAAAGGFTLHVRLRAERALGDKDVGEVRVPLGELLAGAGDAGTPVQFVSYQISRVNSGKAQGVLNISYKLGPVTGPTVAAGNAAGVANSGKPSAAYPPAAAYPPQSAYPPASGVNPNYSTAVPYPPPPPLSEPVTAYPAGPSSGNPYPPPPAAGKLGKESEPVTAYPAGPSSGNPYSSPYGAPPPAQPYVYPPQPYGYPPQPYGYLPQPGYGYPPQSVYGYQPVQQQQQPQKNNFGLGLGAGLLGGAVGGLLIGDLIGESAGYDAGFADGGFF